MSYNTDLQSNNTDLQAILDAVNALPEAKKIETVTGTIEMEAGGDYVDISPVFYYLNPNFEAITAMLPATGALEFTAVKNSVVAFEEWAESWTGCEDVLYDGKVLRLTENGFSIVIHG